MLESASALCQYHPILNSEEKLMTDEERQRQMDFIIEQQAQTAVTLARLSEKVDRTADSVNALLAIAEIHDQEIKATDERLNALVSMVERYIDRRGDEIS
jgi:ABC-type transporter Mla subunit MlaD